MRYLLLLFSIFLSFIACAQKKLYVNTDNLVMRDRPKARYNVLAILHNGMALDIDATDHGFDNNMAINNRFYQVSFLYTKNGRSITLSGWVEKKYIVTDPEMVTQKPALQGKPDYEITSIQGKIDDLGRDKFNDVNFAAPKYKGGESDIQYKSSTITYYSGPRGGCYYINNKGKRVYVEAFHCK